jgi:hypothetical protein
MKLKIFLKISILFFSQLINAQSSNPIGKWYLVEHYIHFPIDTINGIVHVKDSNIYQNQFVVSITYKPNGEYLQEIGNDEIRGEWEMKQRGKKFQFRVRANGYFIAKSKYRKIHQFNFEHYPHSYYEYIPHFCDYAFINRGGTSYYKRIERQDAEFNDTLLVGKWINNSLTDSSNIYISEYKVDKTYQVGIYNLKKNEYVTIHYTGKWLIAGREIVTSIDKDPDSTHYEERFRGVIIEQITEKNLSYSYSEGRNKLKIANFKRLE